MKTKQAIWLLIGFSLITLGNPLQVNGVDLVGWVIVLYTVTRIHNLNI